MGGGKVTQAPAQALAGFFGPAGLAAEGCPAGSYCPLAAAAALACPDGTSSPPRSSSPTACTVSAQPFPG